MESSETKIKIILTLNFISIITLLISFFALYQKANAQCPVIEVRKGAPTIKDAVKVGILEAFPQATLKQVNTVMDINDADPLQVDTEVRILTNEPGSDPFDPNAPKVDWTTTEDRKRFETEDIKTEAIGQFADSVRKIYWGDPENPNSEPQYVVSPHDWLNEIPRRAVVNAILGECDENEPYTCAEEKLLGENTILRGTAQEDLEQNLISHYTSPAAKPDFTSSLTVADPGDALDPDKGGGWDEFLLAWMDPNNNPYGIKLKAQAYADKMYVDIANSRQAEFLAYRGVKPITNQQQAKEQQSQTAPSEEGGEKVAYAGPWKEFVVDTGDYVAHLREQMDNDTNALYLSLLPLPDLESGKEHQPPYTVKLPEEREKDFTGEDFLETWYTESGMRETGGLQGLVSNLLNYVSRLIDRYVDRYVGMALDYVNRYTRELEIPSEFFPSP